MAYVGAEGAGLVSCNKAPLKNARGESCAYAATRKGRLQLCMDGRIVHACHCPLMERLYEKGWGEG